MVADDESDITMIFALGLEDDGFKVDVFDDPIQALSGFKSGLYDLALIDYKMPNMNGFELYREISKINTKVKVCFLTASEIYNETLRVPPHGLLDGVNCFIPKPVDIDELVKK